ncbi:3-keto-5-aminohexanoate cleavage protein [Martelella limonii]|uniref:3-keto-5-aminohexanoate cleavage protein n=1 Tax=Martelella limonii TaxID=1647649 RepID=UPI0015802217
MADNVIVTLAPTSNFKGKDAIPALPEQPAEIARSVRECYDADVCLAHMHARSRGPPDDRTEGRRPDQRPCSRTQSGYHPEFHRSRHGQASRKCLRGAAPLLSAEQAHWRFLHWRKLFASHFFPATRRSRKDMVRRLFESVGIICARSG